MNTPEVLTHPAGFQEPVREASGSRAVSAGRLVILASGIGSVNRGIGQYQACLLPHLLPLLTSRGWKVTVLLSRDADLPGPMNGVRYARLPSVHANSMLRLLAEQLYVPCLSWRADVFLALDAAFPFTPVLAKRKLAVVHDIHVLQHIASPDEYPEDYTWRYKFWATRATRRGVRAADRLIADSRYTSQEVQSLLRVPADRITTIHLGVDHSRFHPRIDRAALDRVRKRYALPQSFYLFVGPFSRKKNLRLIVEAYVTHASGDPRRDVFLPVVVVGDPRRNKLYTDTLVRIERTGRADLFRFLGFVPDDDMPALYRAARALLYPSLYEGFGFPVLEALACGSPVAASNRTSIPEVVGEAALLFDPTRPEALVDALCQLNEESVRKDLVAKGLNRAQRFSWPRTAELTAEVVFQHAGSPLPKMD